MVKNDNLSKYLKERNVTDKNYLNYIMAEDTENEEYKLFMVEEQAYMLSHFLDSSEELGAGLIKTNGVLGLENTNLIAIAVLEGDDVICIDNADNSVWLLSFQSGNKELFYVTETFDEFRTMAIR